MSGGDGDTAAGFRRVHAEQLYQGYVLRLMRERFVAPHGEVFERDVVRTPGAVAVVALDEALPEPEVVLVRQYRPAIDAELLELPAGLRDVHGEHPEVTAGRELAEEAGLAAESFEHLHTYLSSAGFTDMEVIVYLARGLRSVPAAAHGPEEQHLTVVRVPFAQALADVVAGRIVDSKTVIGLLLAHHRL